MIETKSTSDQFLEVFIDELGAFRWKTDAQDQRSTETIVDEGKIWLGAGFDTYDEPYIEVVFRDEKTQKRTAVAEIGSTALFWVNESEDGYETPLEEIDGLQVEVSEDDLGLRRYFVPDSTEVPVTLSFWRTELRDNNDLESQGGWSEPKPVEESDGSLMRQLVKNSLQTAHELV